MDESFTYIIASEERKNTTLPATGQVLYYEIDFGGFSEQYDNYMCEVISLAMTDGITGGQRYLMMVAENLGNNGYFCKGKLSSNETILSFMPMAQISDVYLQTDGGNIKFRVDKCRMPKQIIFYFMRPDFTPVLVGGDLNNGFETKWVLTLRMTPIK